MRRLIAAIALASLVGCGMFDFTSPRKRNRQLTQPGMPKLAAGQIPEGSPRITSDLPDGPTVDQLPPDQPGTVVLVLLDSVRADRTHLCGGERPNTPALDALKAKGAAVSCRAYAPSTWSLPAHASIFTGLDPDKHGLVTRSARLDAAVPTLAEQMSAKGYQTLLISGSPLLDASTGLQRGFHQVKVAENLTGELRADGVVKMLRYEIAQLDPKRPIFLVVNLFDAHDPYPAVPAKITWAKPQDPVAFRGADGATAAYQAFLSGKMEDPARAAYLQRVTDGYDHAISVADAVVGNVARVIERYDLGTHGLRVVVTGTHGENLGERGALRHNGLPWETVTRVPMVAVDSHQRGSLVLPEVLSTTAAFYLVRDGKLPEVALPVQAMSFDEGRGASEPRLRDAVAVWPSGALKLMRVDGQSLRYDVVADPSEAHGDPVTDPAELAMLDGLQKSAAEAEARALALPPDEAVSRVLARLGDAD